MNIFVSGIRAKLASVQPGQQGIQPSQHGRQLVVGQQVGGVQRFGVGLGSGQIMASKSPIKLGRLAQGKHRLSRAASETSAPQPSRFGRLGHGISFLISVQVKQGISYRGSPGRIPRNHHHGVIAGDRTQNRAPADLIDGRREKLGGARRSV